jgi:hypothetical protein
MVSVAAQLSNSRTRLCHMLSKPWYLRRIITSALGKTRDAISSPTYRSLAACGQLAPDLQVCRNVMQTLPAQVQSPGIVEYTPSYRAARDSLEMALQSRAEGCQQEMKRSQVMRQGGVQKDQARDALPHYKEPLRRPENDHPAERMSQQEIWTVGLLGPNPVDIMLCQTFTDRADTPRLDP